MHRPRLRLTRAGLLVAAVTLCAAALGIGVWQLRDAHSPSEPAAAQRLTRTLPPGPSDPAATITSGGHKISCPSGTEPELVLSNAQFDPLPGDGVQFDPGSYRVTLSGEVNNDTNSSIDISALTPVVNGAAWAADVSGPTIVSPGEAQPVSINGTLVVASAMRSPRFGVDMSWQWSDSTLRPCAEKGLLSEH